MPGAGLFFYFLRRRLARWAASLAKPGLLAAFIFLFGLLSSVISAIVAAAVLAELLGFAKAPHAYKARAAVYGAFSIGVGAALLPLGEPLSTIAVAKLRQASFIWLMSYIGVVIERQGPHGVVKMLRSPINTHSMEVGNYTPPPALGQHTEEVLRELGYTDDDIKTLAEKGAIAMHKPRI